MHCAVKTDDYNGGWLHSVVRLTAKPNWSESRGGLFSLRCSSAAGVSSEDQGLRPSEASPEQLLGHDQPRTDQPFNGATDQWSKGLLLVFCSQDGDTGHHFRYICDVCLLQTLFLSWLASKMLPILMFLWVVHLPASTQRIYNSIIQALPFLYYQVISGHFGINCVTLWLTTIKLWCIKLCVVFLERHVYWVVHKKEATIKIKLIFKILLLAHSIQ